MRRDDVMTVFNPRSPDGERRRGPGMDQRHHRISIHAPRMGSDFVQRFITPPASLISIHAPRMGSDLPPLSGCGLFHVFQSTLPGWGATPNPVIRSIRKTNFNPRSPDGERRSLLSLVLSEMRFQSTLPGWGATFNVIGDVGAGVFQSTLPRWGATIIGEGL